MKRVWYQRWQGSQPTILTTITKKEASSLIIRPIINSIFSEILHFVQNDNLTGCIYKKSPAFAGLSLITYILSPLISPYSPPRQKLQGGSWRGQLMTYG
jgi:hypothetical protein